MRLGGNFCSPLFLAGHGFLHLGVEPHLQSLSHLDAHRYCLMLTIKVHHETYPEVRDSPALYCTMVDFTCESPAKFGAAASGSSPIPIHIEFGILTVKFRVTRNEKGHPTGRRIFAPGQPANLCRWLWVSTPPFFHYIYTYHAFVLRDYESHFFEHAHPLTAFEVSTKFLPEIVRACHVRIRWTTISLTRCNPSSFFLAGVSIMFSY